MARPEIAPILGKYFVIRKIDTERTIGGEEVFNHYTGGESPGIPWFVFLDAEGKAIADSGKGEANIGCPFKKEEVAAFGAILRKAVPDLAQEDWAALERSLTVQREELEKRRK